MDSVDKPGILHGEFESRNIVCGLYESIIVDFSPTRPFATVPDQANARNSSRRLQISTIPHVLAGQTRHEWHDCCKMVGRH